MPEVLTIVQLKGSSETSLVPLATLGGSEPAVWFDSDDSDPLANMRSCVSTRRCEAAPRFVFGPVRGIGIWSPPAASEVHLTAGLRNEDVADMIVALQRQPLVEAFADLIRGRMAVSRVLYWTKAQSRVIDVLVVLPEWSFDAFWTCHELADSAEARQLNVLLAVRVCDADSLPSSLLDYSEV